MTQENPIITRYLANFDAGLGELNPEERAAVVRDIRSHISEAEAAGKPLDQILASLGSSDALARAYSVELLLHKPEAFLSRRHRILRVVGLVALGSIPTILAVAVLGVVGVVFALTGVILFVAGQAALSGTLPWWVSMNADPRLAILAGPMLSAVGLILMAGFGLYVRFASRVARRFLPPKQP